MAYHTNDDCRILDSKSQFYPTHTFFSWPHPEIACLVPSLDFPLAQPYYKKMTKINPVTSLSPDSSKSEVAALQAAGPLLHRSFKTLRISCWLKTHTAGGETAV